MLRLTDLHEIQKADLGELVAREGGLRRRNGR